MTQSRSRAAVWAAVAATIAAGGWGAGEIGLPSGYLFAALGVGLGCALTGCVDLHLPDAAFRAGQAVTGVSIGTYLHASTLSALSATWLPVTAVSAATLALTLGAGVLLARGGRVDPATASLGMVAGGASGIVGMSGDIGGDDRLVAFMQYLRVLLVVLLTPLLVAIAFPGHHAAGGADPGLPGLGDGEGWALALGVSAAGAVVGPRLRLPSPALMGPLLLTAALTLAGLTGDATAPPLLREVAFAVIGLQIGLRFERETVRTVAHLLAPVLAAIVALVVACFGLAFVLERTADVTLLDAYLATTPGGLYAVLPIAVGSGADAAFVLAVQSLRVFVMVLAAPAAVRFMLRRSRAEARA